MKTIPILTEQLACFGVCCDLHARCTHYALVDDHSGDSEPIGTCMTREGYPLFVERQRADAPAEELRT